MQSLEWHGQSPLAKWFAVTSTIGVALLAVLAGTMLLGAERVMDSYDVQAPQSFEWLSAIGLCSVLLAWVLHMASILLLLGYSHSGNRVMASFIMTGITIFSLLFISSTSLSVFWPSGMKSMM